MRLICMRAVLCAGIVTFGGMLTAYVATAQNRGADATATESRKPDKSAKTDKLARPVKGGAAVDRQREAAVLAFVAEHHPELEQLLRHLKPAAPDQYQRAIRELARTSDRLASLRERSPDRYKAELQLWQLQSRAQLLAARLKMDDDPKLMQNLQQLLEQKIDLELKILQREHQRQSERLQRLEEQIERKESTRDAILQRQLRSLTQPAKTAPAKTGAAKNRKPRTRKQDESPTGK